MIRTRSHRITPFNLNSPQFTTLLHKRKTGRLRSLKRRILDLFKFEKFNFFSRYISQLMTILGGVNAGIHSVTYIVILMLLIIYLYSVAGIIIFRGNDPWHFRSLEISMITMLRVSLFDDWGEVFYINYYGCDIYQGDVYTNNRNFDEGKLGGLLYCKNPTAQPLLSVIFFHSYIFITSFFVLSLVIGNIGSSMQNSSLAIRKKFATRMIIWQQKDAEIIIKHKSKLTIKSADRETIRLMTLAFNGENLYKKEKIYTRNYKDYFIKSYHRFCRSCANCASSRYFTSLLSGVIICSGITSGLNTTVESTPNSDKAKLLQFIDQILQSLFTLECFIKIMAEGTRPYLYFHDIWNSFDFAIVMITYAADFLGFNVIFLRLVRLFRMMKLFKTLPRLQTIVNSVIYSFSSILSVIMMLVLYTLILSSIAVKLFKKNDPFHFQNLITSILAIFQSYTFDNYTAIMYINIYGCDVYDLETSSGVKEWHTKYCTDPDPQFLLGSFFAIFNVVFGGFLGCTLFIGIMLASMVHADEELKEKQELDSKVKIAAHKHDVPKDIVDIYHRIFTFLDVTHTDRVGRVELKYAFHLTNTYISEEDLKTLFKCIDIDGSQSIDFSEFVYFMIETHYIKYKIKKTILHSDKSERILLDCMKNDESVVSSCHGMFHDMHLDHMIRSHHANQSNSSFDNLLKELELDLKHQQQEQQEQEQEQATPLNLSNDSTLQNLINNEDTLSESSDRNTDQSSGKITDNSIELIGDISYDKNSDNNSLDMIDMTGDNSSSSTTTADTTVAAVAAGGNNDTSPTVNKRKTLKKGGSFNRSFQRGISRGPSLMSIDENELLGDSMEDVHASRPPEEVSITNSTSSRTTITQQIYQYMFPASTITHTTEQNTIPKTATLPPSRLTNIVINSKYESLINPYAPRIISRSSSKSSNLSLTSKQHTECSFVYIKPEANNRLVVQFVKDFFTSKGYFILKEGDIDTSCKNHENYKLICKQYAQFGYYATRNPLHVNIGRLAENKFYRVFGCLWSDMLMQGRVYSCINACKKLGIEIRDLGAAVLRSKNQVKLSSCMHCCYINDILHIPPFYVINGFYASLIADYMDEDASIHYFLIEWNVGSSTISPSTRHRRVRTWSNDSSSSSGGNNNENNSNIKEGDHHPPKSWRDFNKMVGYTDPSIAESGSLRNAIYCNWKNLGLNAEPNIYANCIHSSKSAFEAYVDRKIWLTQAIYEETLLRDLISLKIPEQTIHWWSMNPEVGHEFMTIYDHMHGLGYEECVHIAMDLYNDRIKQYVYESSKKHSNHNHSSGTKTKSAISAT